ncbi:hypothetical protein BRARA_H00266 [Brassica rapa]|uniref:Uncharacterized protein n=1 Tax=Brassica campestris TaxID=3711 RepID=A0A397Y874_BRACM|nr:hypothetical protein BRARA_H00266 [Brassica rapa]
MRLGQRFPFFFFFFFGQQFPWFKKFLVNVSNMHKNKPPFSKKDQNLPKRNMHIHIKRKPTVP